MQTWNYSKNTHWSTASIAVLIVGLSLVAGGGLFYSLPRHTKVLTTSPQKASPLVNDVLNYGELLFVADRVVISDDQWVIVHPKLPDDPLLHDIKTSVPKRVKGKTLVFCNKPGPSAILRIIYEQNEFNSIPGDSDELFWQGLSPPPLPSVLPNGTVTAVAIGNDGAIIDAKTSDVREVRFDCGESKK
jgi:hypothetical protein